MKINELQKIEPLKYNGFFSVHNTKRASKERIYNLPIINQFSRNTNKNLKTYIFKTHNKFNDFFSNSPSQEFDNNLEKVPYPNFSKMTRYLKNKNIKNKTKINPQLSKGNKVNEVYFDINKTEYNNFNKKCFSIDAKNNLKKKNQIRLIKIKNNKMSIDDILEKEKEEFRKTVIIPEKRNKFVNDFSYIIYHHFFPYSNNGHILNNYNHTNKNNIKLQLLNNTNEKKILADERTNNLIKNNTFFEMILEKVIHIVEYKNQLNQEISITIVRNLLNEEINSMWRNLNNKNNSSKITYINKSTSTDDNGYFDFKLLNSTYDKYDKYSNTSISDIGIEKKAKIRLERKLSILNEKYGFSNKYYFLTNYDLNSNSSLNMENYSQGETENIIKSKKNNLGYDEDDDNIEEFIMSKGDNINENLEEFKNKTLLNRRLSLFKTSNIKDILNKFIKGNFNQNKKQGLHIFRNTEQISTKKNIDFNDYSNDMIELYQNYLLLKESMKKEANENNSLNKNNSENLINSYDNNLQLNLNNINTDKDHNNINSKPKISSNHIFKDFFSNVNNDKEFEDFMNEFVGYYTFGEKKNIKEILKKMRESKKLPNYSNIKLNTNANKNAKSRNLYTTNKGLLNRASQKIYKEKIKTNIVTNNNNKNEENITKENKNKSANYNKNENNKSVDENNKNQGDKSGDDKNKNDFFINKGDNKFMKDFIYEKGKEDIIEENDNIENENEKEIDDINKEFDITKYNDNYLNELEKEFLKQTNNLDILSDKDKQQIIKYLNEIKSLSEKGENGIISIKNKININHLHYQIEKFILTLYKKGIIDIKSKEKGTRDIFSLLKNRNFYEKQRRILEEELEEDEEIETEDKKIRLIGSDKEVDLNSMFIKGKKRSKSVDYKKFRCYYTLYHKLLFKILKKKKFVKTYSGKKKLGSDDWRTIIKRKIKINISKKKKPVFIKKKKKKTIKITIERKNLMTDEYKDIVPTRQNYEEDDEIREFQEEERRKKLKQDLIDKKMDEFFKKIQRLKKGGLKNFEKELEMLVEEQLERLDYAKEKENEYRVNNFIQDFDLNRSKGICTQKFRSKRMHYLSPIIFFTNRKRYNSNESKQ